MGEPYVAKQQVATRRLGKNDPDSGMWDGRVNGVPKFMQAEGRIKKALVIPARQPRAWGS
jgi:hypothetical protein